MSQYELTQVLTIENRPYWE